ncbi:NADP malic enzyme [Raphidocelis subcapitata]|uniref:Malic enzyme n=1 Tax=Raphidocelis subcapitata TaxID=307507 RepID=A0A2V0NJU2_9CHLO|nr:NADP malic enzyme [Raphidocelis subcapitata]|eukprot:GBF87516.1 NADP malic enzyme [Raphidocelis subcapitata]
MSRSPAGRLAIRACLRLLSSPQQQNPPAAARWLSSSTGSPLSIRGGLFGSMAPAASASAAVALPPGFDGHYQAAASAGAPPPAAPAAAASSDASMARLRALARPIDRYLALRDLLAADPRAYYSLLLTHTEEILPFVYTPTVGDACLQYHRLPIKTWGLYLTLDDRGRVLEKLRSLPQQDVHAVVMTDGERILGLGDLGANGMGISEGKIALYTVAAGLDPASCLPLCIDVGTNNASLLEDPQYKGLRRRRPARAEFDSFMAEVMGALAAWRPHVMVQFEDFGNSNAFRLLDSYRHTMCAFNDDIQGTAGITLAGLLSAARATGRPLIDHRILFLGAGEAGTGIGELVARYLHLRHGVTVEEGRARCFYLDSKGLVCASRRPSLQHHKLPFAHDADYCADLRTAVQQLRPTALIGVSTIGGAFKEGILRLMAEINDRPIVFPLSNPTSQAECTFEQALEWTGGRVLFASGSPFSPARDAAGALRQPAQANNVYIFPALGAAAIETRAAALPDEAFVVAAEELAGMTTLDDVNAGRLFPPFSSIRAVSARVSARVAEFMVGRGLGAAPPGVRAGAARGEWAEYFSSRMWGAEAPMRSKL